MPSSVAAAEPHVMRLEYAQLQPGLSSLVHDIKQQGCNISFVISIFSLILSCNIFPQLEHITYNGRTQCCRERHRRRVPRDPTRGFGPLYLAICSSGRRLKS